MRAISLALTLPPPSQTAKNPILCKFNGSCINWAEKTVVGVLSGALSFGLLLSSPCSIALQSPLSPSRFSSSFF
ncbi:carboxyl-terminal-processing peptidase 1, chloroplastic [Quillaja saponaria]|uniref:Carboxyl-terminal-processing peptidase 1, chloroplastic n=1 Tax=Quillaja saponaria TaxID=32244 RepID=A0AAD7KWM2_QUISA|nr:carboxyl-terminal-processing peptidase 1, chloroplastic [Quillaja saponaria]